MNTKELKAKDLNGLYGDIAEMVDVESAVKLFEKYKGLQINFPLRLLGREYVIINL